MRLTDRFEDSVTIDSVEYSLDLSFDNILRVYELREDDEISVFTKVEYMFDMLVNGAEHLNLSIEQKSTIIEHIFNTFVFKQRENEDSEPQEDDVPPKRIWDINKDAELIYASFLFDYNKKDAELIYASFLFDYNIDLFEQQGKLHWRKFIALLNGLSEDSPFMQVVRIRTMEVPKPNKYNAKERATIQRLKRLYALEQEPSSLDSAFDAVAKRLGKVGEANGRRKDTD